MKFKNSIITGGAGFVGSNLVDRLVSIGHKVIVLDNFVSGKKSNLSHHSKKNVKIIKLESNNILNRKYLTPILGIYYCWKNFGCCRAVVGGVTDIPQIAGGILNKFKNSKVNKNLLQYLIPPL